MRNYGEYLKRERENNNLSQSKLAKLTGISQQKISYYESEKYEPPISVCEILADFYGITVDELIGRDYEKASKIKNAVTYKNSVHNGDNNF